MVDEHCLCVAHGSDLVNRTGVRRTTMQPGQAPFGCKWFSAWTANVQVGEDKDQRAIVVYKKGQTGERSFTGLGNSQMQRAGARANSGCRQGFLHWHYYLTPYLVITES